MVKFVKTIEDYREAIRVLASRDILAVDTETTGLDPRLSELLLVQLGNEARQYVFDYHALKRLGETFTGLKEILTSPKIVKVFHNAKFDYKMLKVHLGVETTNMVCTFILEHLLKKGIRMNKFGLADLVSNYLNITLDKAVRQTFETHNIEDSFTDDQVKYSALDVEYLIQIYQLQLTQLKAWNMQRLVTLECQAIAPTGDMELNGIYLDPKKWTALFEESERSRVIAEKELLEELGGTVETFRKVLWEAAVDRAVTAIEAKRAKKQVAVNTLPLFGNADINIRDIAKSNVGPVSNIVVNLNSSIQMKALLSLHIGREIASTDEETLSKMDDIPVISKVIALRKATKLCTTYGEEFLRKAIHPVTGRIHTNFNQIRADSGRYSSSDPVNLQNIPNKTAYRAAFTVQDPDWRMICADYSGCELRLIAEICQEYAWIDAFKKGYDLHSYVASMLYGIPYEKLVDENHVVRPEYKKFRTNAKSTNFGVAYGMKAGRLANTLKVPVEEARTLLNTFWKTFPSIKAKLNSLAKDALENYYAISPLDGRRRYLRQMDLSVGGDRAHAENIAKNLPFQGANASITKQALVNIRDTARDLGWYNDKFRILITVHDKFCCV